MEFSDVLTVLVKIYVIGILTALSYYFLTSGVSSAPHIFKYLTPVAAVLMFIITITITIEGYHRRHTVTERYDDDRGQPLHPSQTRPIQK